ncbi:hypothetical protein [Methylosinus sp. Sm6]|uniref:hypothetical protein n=1 Tax=Methylosinus sp. Sm6 TaxID=2866948 RepID=UPI001C99E150|nr:hypothetical protein [Methylosinus sp. Sm6]MBY6239745.1 hypothetical protein [Methylosinus sp. Sm6]
MSLVISPPRFGRRRPARKTPRVDAEIVFKTFVRTLERLRETPRAPCAATREKA